MEELRPGEGPSAHIPASWTGHPDSRGTLFDLGEQVTADAANTTLRELHGRLRTLGNDIRSRTRREYLLMDRVAVLRRFGRPHYISESQTGASENWTYHIGDQNVGITIRGDYVISIR